MNWNKLTQQSAANRAPVSENANAVVIQHRGSFIVRLNGGDWVPTLVQMVAVRFPAARSAHIAITADNAQNALLPVT